MDHTTQSLYQDNSRDEHSDSELQIVLETPPPKKKPQQQLNETEKKIIECVEKDIEDTLEEKAAKTKLTAKNVKNILKHVVTNEAVLALVRHVENPEENEPVTVYEPKFTRAKVKELQLASPHQNVLPWVKPIEKKSETHVLIGEELQEDSSGDEYVPESPTKTEYTETEPEISPTKSVASQKEANIALRTRSKLCLSQTPLEELECSFMPPDITTDMYDMDCDDDVWTEFLKTFTKPLDEMAKNVEDEERDPEYNILADEAIDEVDKEELRADRAVTVSRKEMNALVAELHEYTGMYESYIRKNSTEAVVSNVPNCGMTAEQEAIIQSEYVAASMSMVQSDEENGPDITIKRAQIPLLAQQLRQHVQMLTHNFMLTYNHPELGDMAPKFKDCLLSMKRASEDGVISVYNLVYNLNPAIQLILYWEKLFARAAEILDYQVHTYQVIVESINSKQSGVAYSPTFHPLFLETVLNSDVFIYPHLLPRVSFKSLEVHPRKNFLTHSENHLIAIFLDLLKPFSALEGVSVHKRNRPNLQQSYWYIHNYLMPHVTPQAIEKHVRKLKHPLADENPIKYYFRNKRAPTTSHYVHPIKPTTIVPPIKQPPNVLPHFWREYVEKHYQPQITQPAINATIPIIILPTVSVVPIDKIDKLSNFSKKTAPSKRLAFLRPKGPLPSTAFIRRRRRCWKDSTASPLKYTVNDAKMLPDMPNLGTPVKDTVQSTLATIQPPELKNEPLEEGQELSKSPDEVIAVEILDFESLKNSEPDDRKTEFEPTSNQAEGITNPATKKPVERQLTFENLRDYDEHYYKPESTNISRNFESISEGNKSLTDASCVREHVEDGQGSVTIKTPLKIKPSGAEKKRAKIRKEFVQNLQMATPDSPEVESQKESEFAAAYLDKIQTLLDPEEWKKLMHVLTQYDEENGQFLDLYKAIEAILTPKYPDLSEEFLLFLSDIQAQAVGKLMPYFMIKVMSTFVKKLQIYFKDQPAQIKKILKCLTDLSENPDLKMEDIKGAMLPLIKGNAALTNWFLQSFACERPPKILAEGPYESVNINKELARLPNEEICETVVVPDGEDPYGSPSCICKCHCEDNPQYQSRNSHCNRCGLKFLHGKIFFQTGKCLRPAVVSFITNPEKDHTQRLSATQRKRSDVSPSKQASPNKDVHNHDENRHSDSEDDCDGGKKKARRKAKVKHRVKTNNKSTKVCDKLKTEVKPTKRKRPPRKRTTSLKKVAGHKPGSTAGQQKRPAEEASEVEAGPAELVNLSVKSDHSGESESEFFTNTTDSDSSEDQSDVSPVQENNRPEGLLWTREEDKIILQTFQQHSNNEETFKLISQLLENRSVVEIKNRFKKLLILLQQMSSNSAT